MITFTQKGDFLQTKKTLKNLEKISADKILNKYGPIGVSALSSATPIDSGQTASSWYYEIESSRGYSSIVFKNSNLNAGVNIAIILQYGHGTGTGGWVQGIDYINPAMKPVFEKIANDVWKEVMNA